MKKRLLPIICVIVLIFGGCSDSSDRFLSYEDTTVEYSYSLDNQLTQGKFFAENLTIVSEEVNTGGDTELIAGASLLVNTDDNTLLYADHVYDRLFPASLTKLLTALVILQKGDLTESVTISYNASHITESGARVCGYKEGDSITLEALLNSILIYSGNDAAIAAAEHIGGNEEAFVEMMNEEAKKIGAVHSNFSNSHGLHNENHYTTAYDMYLIFNELLTYDTIRTIISLDTYTASYKDVNGNLLEKTFQSSNLYIKGDVEVPEGITIIGGKTGTTSKAGNCLILLSKDADEKEYISTILKTSDSDQLYSQMSHLLTYIDKN